MLVRPLLAEADSPWAERKRRELAELLLEALDVLAEARLALGEHGHAAAAAEDAIELEPFRESAHRLLMRVLVEAGNGGAALRAYERCRRLLADELGVDPSPDTQSLHLAILQAEPPAATSVAPVEPLIPPVDDRCPYAGLHTFEQADAEWFFGRSADVSRLLDRFGDTRFLTVLGPSGSGKSSLVRAGLLTALRHGALAGSDTWTVRVLRPGAVPVEALVAELAAVYPGLDQAAIQQALRDDGLALHHAVEEAVDRGLETGRVVLVVDQLEEVFTLCSDADQRRTFLDALAAAAAVPTGRTLVITTLRADFYHRLADHPRFADLASAHQFLVTPMTEVGLAEAVEGPARRAGLALEPGLTETILRDVARRPGSLPLLSHALYELWERRSDATLTLDAYRQAGGVQGSLAQRAEAIHTGLTAEEQVVARRVLLRLTQPGEATGDTRRRVPFTELPTRPDEHETVEAVVATLTAARLLTAGGLADGRRWVEVSHEALIRGWPRLRRWVDEDRGGLIVHRRVTEAAAEWERLGRDDGALYRGARLAEAVAWAERDPEAANEQERAFLDASVAQETTERRQRLRRLRVTVAALAVGLLAVAVLSVVALVQAGQASREARVATARGLAAAAAAQLDFDPERSILLALQAVATTRAADGDVLPEAQEALHRAVKRSRLVLTVPHGHHSVGVSPDGERFATADEDGSVTIWAADSGDRMITLDGHGGWLPDMAFSPDGGLLATAADDDTTRVWDARSGALVGTLEGGDAVRFSPDGTLLAAASGHGVRLIEVATWTETGRLADDPISLAFSPDGSLLVAGNGDSAARIWEVQTGKRVMTLTGHTWGVTAVAVSPDGRQVATAGVDGTARTWDLETGQHLQTFFADGILFGVEYSPDGSRVAIASADGTAAVWDAETGGHLMTLAGHASIVGDVAFTPDGERLVTTSNDGTTRVWDVSVGGSRDWLTVPTAYLRFVEVAFSPDGRWFAAPTDAPHGVTIWDTETGAEVMTLTGHEGAPIDVAFSADGSRLAAATFDQTIPVWDLSTGELALTLAGHHGEGSRMVAFSPDGARLLSGSYDGTARVWDLSTGDLIAILDRGQGAVDAVAYSSDGRYLATGDDAAATVWDAETFEELRALPSDYVNGIAFGPDGLLVSASDDGTATVWDVRSGTAIATLSGHTGSVEHVSISPDGTRVATAGHEGTAKVWDAADGRRLFTLSSHSGPVWSTAFSPDGRLLATASSDGTVAVHLLPIDELVDLARARVTRGLTDDECRQYLQLPSCPPSGPAR